VNVTAPLDRLTVLEIASFVAGPLGGLTLAQLGADVIRIDPVGGGADLGRWPLAPSGTSLFWTSLNKGKRSVTLNFRHAQGRRLLGDLLTASGPGGGIVVTNAAPALGADTAAVLTGLLGLSAADVRALADRGIIGGPVGEGGPGQGAPDS
jgi:2-methylfumaryl-CoA isomerase